MKSRVSQILTRPICILLVGTGTVYSQNITLVYKFRMSEIDRYKESSRTVMSSETMPGGSQVFTNETYTSQRVEKVNSDGSTELIRTVDSTNSTMNGMPFENPATKGALGFPLRVKVASTGKVLDVQSAKDSLDETATAVLEAFRGQLMSQPSYPQKPVNIDDGWLDSTRITQKTQMGVLTTLIKYSTTLTGSDTIAGVRVWVLKMSISLSGSIEGGAGTVDGTGEGTVYFSGDLGKEVKSILDINQSMNVNGPQGSMSMTMKTTTTRELMK
jgi:hypothetical protein